MKKNSAKSKRMSASHAEVINLSPAYRNTSSQKAVSILYYTSAEPTNVKVVAGTVFGSATHPPVTVEFEVWREDLEAVLTGSKQNVGREGGPEVEFPLEIHRDKRGNVEMNYYKKDRYLATVILSLRAQKRLLRAMRAICPDLTQASESLTDGTLSSLLKSEH